MANAMNLVMYKNKRSLWHLDRNSTFWEFECQKNGDDFFKVNFRMNRRSFIKLCGYLQHMGKKNSNFRASIPLEKRVAIALYALGSSAEYRSIGNLFGVAKSTVCSIFLEFCEEVWRALFPLYLRHFPLSRGKIEECVAGFQELGFPQCLGALDGCHIEIHPKSDEAVDYFNYKGWYSTVLLALVDSRFLYINVGSPGRCNDSQIFENSSLKRELQESSLLQEMSVPLSGTDVGVLILGDSAFRFSPYLMKPYPFHLNNTAAQRSFNYNLSKCRRVVENAFGHLKARFRRIGKGIDNKIENSNLVIKASCVLHNFLIMEKDAMVSSWLQDQNTIESRRRYPTHSTNLQSNSSNAELIRQALASHFKQKENKAESNMEFIEALAA